MLSFGIYEQVINQIIRQHLGQLENELVKIVTGPIDSAESSKILDERRYEERPQFCKVNES